MSTLTSCIATPPPLVINVPIVYDIIGSKSLASWLYQYPGIPPNGGTTAGFISGRVVDGSSKSILGRYSPIVGACIGLSAPCSGQPGQIQLQTDTNGYYSLSNIPPGTYTLYASAQGYSTVFQTNVVTSVGDTTVVNFLLQPVNSPGVSCLISPTPNPIPFQHPIPGIACMPNWVWYTLGTAVFGVIILLVMVWSPFGGTLVSAAGRSLRGLANRGGNAARASAATLSTAITRKCH
jgi:Carboxypeptidase regulatory-like domain